MQKLSEQAVNLSITRFLLNSAIAICIQGKFVSKCSVIITKNDITHTPKYTITPKYPIIPKHYITPKHPIIPPYP